MCITPDYTRAVILSEFQKFQLIHFRPPLHSHFINLLCKPSNGILSLPIVQILFTLRLSPNIRLPRVNLPPKTKQCQKQSVTHRQPSQICSSRELPFTMCYSVVSTRVQEGQTSRQFKCKLQSCLTICRIPR